MNDIDTALANLARQEQFLEVVSAAEATTRFHRHLALRPLGSEKIALSQALKRPRFDWQFRRSPKVQAIDDVRDVHAPICLVHVKNDWLIGHDHSLALYEAANEPKELHVIDIPGNYHADRIFSVAASEIDPLFTDFLRKYTAV